MRWPGLGVCVDIMAVKKHILVPAIYMTVTDFFFPLFSSIPCNSAHSLVGIIDTLAQAAKIANLETWIS